jgi:hypothetical protein
MQRIDMEHGGYLSHLSKDDVMAFYREELGIVGGTPPQQGHPSESGK